MDPAVYQEYQRSTNPFIFDAMVQLSSDHRFRGYPSGMMESPRTRHPHPVQEKHLPGLLPAAEPCQRTWSPPLGYPPPPLPPASSVRPDPSSWSEERHPHYQRRHNPSSPKKHDLSDAEVDVILTKHFEDNQKKRIMAEKQRDELKLDLTHDQGRTASPMKSPGKDNSEKRRKVTNEVSSNRNDREIATEPPMTWPLNKYPPNSFPPFGSPGGGNPNFDKDGKRIAIIPGPSTVMRDEDVEKKKSLAAKMYNQELEQAILVRELMKIKEKQSLRSLPTETLLDKMHHSQTGKPRRHPNTGQLADQHLGSSDITNLCNITPRNYHSFGQAPNASTRYGTELERQAEERKLCKVLDRNQDIFEDKKHCDTCDKQYGSSVPENLRKQDLMRLLYDPDFKKNEYKKPVTRYAEPYYPSNTNFVKNNIGAHHGSHFEIPEAPQCLSSEFYHVRAPYFQE